MRKHLCKIIAAVVVMFAMSVQLKAQPWSHEMPVPDTLSSRTPGPMKLSLDNTHKKFFYQVTETALSVTDTPVIGALDSPAVTNVIGWPNSGNFIPQDTLPVPTYSFNSPGIDTIGILGPTLITYTGDSVRLEVTNNLMDTATVHWHGEHIPTWTDGGPHQPIPPGTTWKPYFKQLEDATTLWYHPHLHMMTQDQVQKGLAGMIIVRDPSDPFAALLPHTYGKDEFPIIIQDREFDRGALGQPAALDVACSMGPLVLVNGEYQPYLMVPDQSVRFRVLNGSSERSYALRFRTSLNPSDTATLPFKIIASDGGYLPAPDSTELYTLIAPGERYEIIVDLTNHLGDSIYLFNYPNLLPATGAGGPTYDNPGCYVDNYAAPTWSGSNNGGLDSVPHPLLKLIVNHDATIDPPIHQIPSTFKKWDIPSVNLAQRVRTKHFVFQAIGNGPPFQIDSLPFDMDVLNDTVILGDTEVWNIVNETGVAHPFHIHDVEFYVTQFNHSSSIPAYLQGPKDVVLVQGQDPVTGINDTVQFITTFTDFATQISPDSSYMYHCHILAHEDHGMMHQFAVIYPPGSGVKKGQPEDAVQWELYPNPATGIVTLEGSCDGPSTVRIYDLLGVKLKEISFGPVANGQRLNIKTLTTGVYVVEWVRPGGITTRRLVVQ